MKRITVLLCLMLAMVAGSVQAALPTPLAHWAFETTGPGANQTPDTLGVHHANLIPGGGQPVLVPGGAMGNAMQLDVLGEYATAQDPTGGLSIGTGDGTIALWFRHDGPTFGEAVYIEKLNPAGGRGWTLYSIPANSHNTVEFYVHGIGVAKFDTTYLTPTLDIDDGAWHHIALTKTANAGANVDEVRLYIDGLAMQVVGSAGGVTVHTHPLNSQWDVVGSVVWMGKRNPAPWGQNIGINGALDEAYIFNVALTAEEIGKLMLGPILVLPPTTINVSEIGPTSDTYYIEVLADPNTVDPNAMDVVVDITFDDTQVIVNSDTVSPAQVTIVNGDGGTSIPIVVEAIDDASSETTPHVTIISHTVSSASSTAFDGYVLADVDVNIEDNDTPGITVTPGPSVEVKEGGYSDTYIVELESAPIGTVIVSPDVNTQVQTDTAASFDSSNWSTPQTITVSAINDSDVEGYHATIITHTVGGTDGIYGALSAGDVTVGIVDNEVTYPANLIGMWKCELQDVPSSGLTPSELGGYPGAYNGMTFGPGMDGQGLYGDADGDSALRVADGGGLTIGTGNFTVTLWTMITQPVGNPNTQHRGEMVIAEKFQGPVGPGWTCYTRAPTDAERTLLLWPGTGSDTGFQNFAQAYGDPYQTAQGHFWAIVRDVNEISIYMNGVLQGTKELPPSYDFGDAGLPLSFGNRNQSPPWPFPLYGGIDEIRFYNTALSEAEIQTVMNDYVPYCGNYLTLSQTMDFNGDCYVDLTDFAAFAQKWLACTDTADPVNCDVTP